VLLIGYSGEVSLRERTFDASAELLEDRRFRFTLAPAFSPLMSDN